MQNKNWVAALAFIFASFVANTEEVKFDASDFGCLTDMTPVRDFYVDNLLGDLEGTLKAAQAENGAVYPPGSVVQLIPTEVMVKREKGYNQVTKDWEFIELSVSPKGSEINVRGAFEVVNKFGGNCFGCHIKAQPQWDLICEDDRGCDPITAPQDINIPLPDGKVQVLPKGTPIPRTLIKAFQSTDPRCQQAS